MKIKVKKKECVLNTLNVGDCFEESSMYYMVLDKSGSSSVVRVLWLAENCQMCTAVLESNIVVRKLKIKKIVLAV